MHEQYKALKARKIMQRLTPGNLMDLEISSVMNKKRVKCMYYGMIPGESVMLSHPQGKQWEAMDEFIVPGNDVVVRAIIEGQEGKVIAFKTKIDSIVTKPARVVTIEFPYKVISHSLRSHQRLPTLLPAEVTIEPFEETFTGTIRNVSANGMQIHFDSKLEQLEIGKRYPIEIKAQYLQEQEYTMTGTICNIRTADGETSLGISIDKNPELEQLLNSLMIDTRLIS